jgi:hypothetical protein
MAFNFFGTFTRAQWREFKDFIEVQRTELYARRNWLDSEISRTGQVSCSYDDEGNPVSFEASPKTYIGKLLLAYRILGGIPENDMLLRTRDQVVYLKQGIDEDDRPEYSNGRLNRGTQRFDRSLGLSVESLKRWQIESIKSKRESLEFKIKRAMDYADQLQQELSMIDGMLSSFAVENQLLEVELLMNQPDRYNIPSGEGDKFGLKIGETGDGARVDSALQAASGNQRVPQTG